MEFLTGMSETYLLSYVECSKDKFKSLWMSYLAHVKTYSCDEYCIQRTEECYFEQSFYIQGVESIYMIDVECTNDSIQYICKVRGLVLE